MIVHFRFEHHTVVTVFDVDHFAVFTYARHQRTGSVWQQRLDMHVRRRQHGFHLHTQLVDAFAGKRRYDVRFRHQRLDTLACGLIHTVGLVEHDNRGNGFDAVDVGKHIVDRVDLRERVRMRSVHHMHDQIGFGNLLQRGFERFNQLRRQSTHEPDGIDVRILTSIFGTRPAHCGVQCGE